MVGSTRPRVGRWLALHNSGCRAPSRRAGPEFFGEEEVLANLDQPPSWWRNPSLSWRRHRPQLPKYLNYLLTILRKQFLRVCFLLSKTVSHSRLLLPHADTRGPPTSSSGRIPHRSCSPASSCPRRRRPERGGTTGRACSWFQSNQLNGDLSNQHLPQLPRAYQGSRRNNLHLAL